MIYYADSIHSPLSSDQIHKGINQHVIHVGIQYTTRNNYIKLSQQIV